MENRDIIVIGGSAGAIEVLFELVPQLPEKLRAAVFIVIHTTAESPGALPSILERHGRLPAKLVEKDQKIQCGRVYVAKPDQHLVLKPNHVVSARGPRENGFRPAIDPLFRSAAAYHGTRVVGILLSGLLDDGVAGFDAIRRCGGVTLAQDPSTAAFPSLPSNAIKAGVVNHVFRPKEFGALIGKLLEQKVRPRKVVPADILKEIKIDETVLSHSEELSEIAKPIAMGCPDCGGPLFQVKKSKIARFRCHMGHALSAGSLLDAQNREMEKALWFALRTLEEKKKILEKIVATHSGHHGKRVATGTAERLREVEEHAGVLRKMLENASHSPEAGLQAPLNFSM